MSKAVSLQHVEMSNQLNPTMPAEQQEFFAESLPPSPEDVPQIKYHIFKLVKMRKGRVHVDGICDDVLNPKTNKRERIYLLQGASNIWESELEPILKDKDSYKRRRRNLLFVDGICRLRSDQENWLEFARRSNHNAGKRRVGVGKFDFYEYDVAEEQKARLDRQMNKLKTVIAVNELSEDQIKKLASFLGIVFYDEIGQLKGPDGIKSELLLKADVQPELVKKYMGSEEVEIAYLVKKGILDAKIDLQGQNGNAIWSGGKGFICKIPAARKAHEYLTELAMTNSDEGRQFKEQLKTIVT